MNDIKRISQNQAGKALLSGEKVFAMLSDGRTDRIMSINWTKCTGTMREYAIESEIQYFFQYVRVLPVAA